MAAVVAQLPVVIDYCSDRTDDLLALGGPAPGRLDAPAYSSTAGSGQSTPEQAEAAVAGGRVPPNGGSIGHPVICSRPCLYYTLGECANGDACAFCHMPHPKATPRPCKPKRMYHQLFLNRLSTVYHAAPETFLAAVHHAAVSTGNDQLRPLVDDLYLANPCVVRPRMKPHRMSL
mmetsp:Transcript_58480/g.169683  ORF Transcript_58480/g.169683 Transcript_58480/m.169683 type:complete len:175 (+) Transcript_58480:93-617(+)